MELPAPPPRKSMRKKTFKVKKWESTNKGEKCLIYAETGMGKTTLAATAPSPIFIGLDDGGRKIKHPATGEDLDHIENVETFEDVRAVLQQPHLFEDCKTIVIDTVTILQDLAETYVVATVPTEKGIRVKNLLGYGYNKGYKHLYNTMKLILSDCDTLVQQGKNVILVAQSIVHSVANPSGEDFLRDGPRLHIDKSWSVEALYCEWCDHIFRIDYQDVFVADKKIKGSTTRVIHTQPEVYFRAKSKSLADPIISFESPRDDSLWRFLFGDKNAVQKRSKSAEQK